MDTEKKKLWEQITEKLIFFSRRTEKAKPNLPSPSTIFHFSLMFQKNLQENENPKVTWKDWSVFYKSF